MTREFSAGGIVLRLVPVKPGLTQDKFSKKKIEVLLTQHSSNHYWGFPKGKIDPGQTSKDAALREVKEEGGVEAEIVEKVGDSKYVYTWEGEKIFKIVTIYLMKYTSGDPKDHDWEVSEAGWYQPEEALKKLSFSQDKKLLETALILKDKIASLRSQ